MDENRNTENRNEIEEVNAMLEEDTPVDSQELQDSILEDSNLSGFQLWLAKLDDRRFLLYQRLAGIVLGLIAAAALFWDNFLTAQQANQGGSIFSWSLIAAIIIALWIPNLLEKYGLRKIPALRVTLAIVLGVAVVAFFLLSGIRSGWNFTAKP